jgi:hypothetical protein
LVIVPLDEWTIERRQVAALRTNRNARKVVPIENDLKMLHVVLKVITAGFAPVDK